MKTINFLLPSSIGLALVALVFSLATWNASSIWIPIALLLVVLSIIIYFLRNIFKSIEERLDKLEGKTKK
jgi:hypothetical protein